MTTLRLSPAALAARKAGRPAPSIPASPADDLEARLAMIWPHLFGNRDAPVPLAIGIHHAIKGHLQPDELPHLRKTLRRWVGRKAYLRSITQPGARRVDLQGNVTPITPAQIEHAKSYVVR